MRTKRVITKDECPWLDENIPKGTTVYEYCGCTYGCVDSGIPVTFKDGETPFFEIPKDSVTPERSEDDE